MDNLRIYSAGRAVPDNAIKKIQGGSYGAAGLSDINPQWRIETLTAIFGPCGDGWYIDPQNVWVEGGTMYAHIHLFYKLESGEWSRPVNGWGGTKLSGKDDSDAVKSTITDAFGNACRYLGIGADVWLPQSGAPRPAQFDTKYSAPPQQPSQQPKPAVSATPTSSASNTHEKVVLATPFQVSTICEMISNDERNAMVEKYGESFERLSFEGARKQIDEIKKRKGIS